MYRYIAKRLLAIIPVLIFVIIFVFILMYFVPGDPVSLIFSDYHITEQQIQEIREEWGLNDPFFVQLWNYVKGVLRFDFGNSYISKTSVAESLTKRFPITVKLAFLSLLIVTFIGVPLGIWCALHAGKFVDRALMVVTLVLNCMPSFWLGLLLILLFSVKLRWLPSYGINNWKCWIMPALASSLAALAGICRQTRSSMLEVIRSDFVTTAKAKGVSSTGTTYKHALPNALIPIITVLGTRFGAMLGGTTVIETVFSIPGIGTFLISGINNRDYPVVRGGIIYIAITFSLMMLVIDLLYSFADPRIRAQYAKKKKRKEKSAA